MLALCHGLAPAWGCGAGEVFLSTVEASCWQQELLAACPAVASKGLPWLMKQVDAGIGDCGTPALCPQPPFTLAPGPQVLSLHYSSGKTQTGGPQDAFLGTLASLAIVAGPEIG